MEIIFLSKSNRIGFDNKSRLISEEKPYIINRPEHKFETVLFLPEGEGRKGEGGLRTKGYFKHSYKLDKDNGVWYICDTENNPVKPAPDEIQKKIKEYLSSLPDGESITELPLISVITVVLNGEKYLEETIQSVINQTYPNVEYIIIDGGSTDGTLDIIKKYEDYIDYWVSEKDKGIYDGLSKGFRVITGKIISYINSGDYYSKNAMEIVSLLFVKKNLKWLTAYNFWYNERGYVIGVLLPFKYNRKLVKCGFYGKILPFIQQESTFWERRLLHKIDLEEFKKFKLAGDFYLWKQFADCADLEIVRAYIGGFKIHQGQLSSQLESYYVEMKRIINTKCSVIDYCRAYFYKFLWYMPDKLKKIINKRIFVYDHRKRDFT